MDRPEPGPRRRWLVPEVLQISALDCGPAALAALLLGCGLEHSVDELRQACRTGRDGTSIDDLEAAAVELGLAAEQVLVPADHLELPEAACAPAILVVLQPGGATHFVTLWRRHGRRVQLMDPGAGRRWPTLASLQGEVYRHRAVVPAAAWRAWAESDGLLRPLGARLRALGVPPAEQRALLPAAAGAVDWRPLAALDAGARFVHRLVAAGGARRGNEAARLLAALLDRRPEGGTAPAGPAPAIPSSCWAARPAPPAAAPTTPPVPPAGAPVVPAPLGGEQVLCIGALLVRVRSLAPGVARGGIHAVRRQLPRSWRTSREAPRQAIAPAAGVPPVPPRGGAPAPSAVAGTSFTSPLSTPTAPGVSAATTSPPSTPAAVGVFAAAASPLSTLAALGVSSATAAAARLAETALLVAALQLLPALAARRLRLGALGGLLAAGAALLLLEPAAARAALALGRGRETGLRLRLAARLPHLPDRYLRTRLLSDLAQRAHQVDEVRRGPAIAAAALRAGFEAALSAAGIAWLDPGLAPLALGSAAAALAVPWLLLPHSEERSRRVRAHAAALGGLYLDVLRGLAAVRAHGAAATLRRRHDELLAGWVRARRGAAAAGARLEVGTQALLALAMAALVLSHVGRHGLAPQALLIVLWSCQLIAAGQRLAVLVGAELPVARNLLRGIQEPLAAAETAAAGALLAAGAAEPEAVPCPPPTLPGRCRRRGAAAVPGPRASRRGVELAFVRARVEVDGRPLLHGLDLAIPAGQHVALLGASGAGKSTLLDTLLGWHLPVAGTLLAGGQALDAGRLAELRRATVWIAPEGRLWDRSLLANLESAAAGEPPSPVLAPIDALRAALLLDLVPQLPDGLQTRLGEAGSRLSGGEAQRLRLARALRRPHIRLALLDEPFRGLAADQRRRLLARARRHWRRATLLCVTHSPAEALGFDRVLVLDAGELREDGAPGSLAGDPGTRFHAMLAAAAAAGAALQGPGWRRIRLRAGRLHEVPAPARRPTPAAAASSRSPWSLRRPAPPAAPHPPPPGRRR